MLSPPYPVKLSGDPDNLAVLAATFDVNGDQVSDLVGPISGVVTRPDATSPTSAVYTLYPAASAAP